MIFHIICVINIFVFLNRHTVLWRRHDGPFFLSSFYPGCPMRMMIQLFYWFCNTIVKRLRGAHKLRCGGDFDDGVMSEAVTTCVVVVGGNSEIAMVGLIIIKKCSLGISVRKQSNFGLTPTDSSNLSHRKSILVLYIIYLYFHVVVVCFNWYKI